MYMHVMVRNHGIIMRRFAVARLLKCEYCFVIHERFSIIHIHNVVWCSHTNQCQCHCYLHSVVRTKITIKQISLDNIQCGHSGCEIQFSFQFQLFRFTEHEIILVRKSLILFFDSLNERKRIYCELFVIGNVFGQLKSFSTMDICYVVAYLWKKHWI